MVPRLYLTFLLGTLASLVAALPRPAPPPAGTDPTAGRSRSCGVHISASRVRQGEARFQNHRTAPVPENATTTLGIYFHVVYANETVEGGYIPDSQIQEQVKVMNRDYSSAGIRWSLKSVSRIKSQDWFLNVAPDSAGELAMKGAYRKGGKGDLNVYTVGFMNPEASGLLGIATFPMDYKSAPKQDGVMLLHASLPGSKSQRFNLGRTLVHEAGHWAGLYHTFQGGCASPGDEVDDTTPQESASKGCPINRKSCPGTKGVDPVQNFMDYSDDSCMTNFSPGQATRMRAQLATYREAKFV